MEPVRRLNPADNLRREERGLRCRANRKALPCDGGAQTMTALRCSTSTVSLSSFPVRELHGKQSDPTQPMNTFLSRFFTACALVLSAPADGPQPVTNSIGMKLVPIAPGTFTMGQDGPAADYLMSKHPAESDHADWDEKPAHKVTITQPFHIGATEVTLGQYRQFKPKHRAGGRDDEAATGVSWFDAVAFCEWLSKKEGRTYRLPTEAEWEYACRAGTATPFNTGDTLPAGYQRWFGEINRRELYFGTGAMPPEYRVMDGPVSLRVAQNAPNAWGLSDMHGNAAEWCGDWYGPYGTGAQTDPLGRSDGDFRVFRGGWHSTFTRLIRSANRGAWIPESVSDTIGFRVVLGKMPKGTLLPPPAPPLNAQNVRQGPFKMERMDPGIPVFSGPKPFVKIPPDSAGPLFSRHPHFFFASCSAIFPMSCSTAGACFPRRRRSTVSGFAFPNSIPRSETSARESQPE